MYEEIFDEARSARNISSGNPAEVFPVILGGKNTSTIWCLAEWRIIARCTDELSRKYKARLFSLLSIVVI